MNTILFDLDGTLLPMDVHAFEKIYFGGLCSILPQMEPKALIGAVLGGTAAMAQNDGSCSNREAFIRHFEAASGLCFAQYEEAFLEYYRTRFGDCRAACRVTPVSRQIVDILKAKGYRLAVATNPMFPQVATHGRLAWLGLTPEDFALVTTYEDSCRAKPNPAYFAEVCQRLGVEPADCVMVGNDVAEDGAAAELGMPVMLVTDCLMNEKELPTQNFWQGSLTELLAWAEGLATVS